jgi:hypothetical protein
MTNITTKLITRLSKNESIAEIFRSELEFAINTLLKSELTAFLDYEKGCVAKNLYSIQYGIIISILTFDWRSYHEKLI